MSYHMRMQLTGLGLLLSLLIGGCSRVVSTSTPVSPTATSLPVSTNPACGTIVTMIEELPELKFGETGLEAELIEYYYDAVITGGGLAEPRNGGIEEVRIDGNTVSLTRKDFSEGYIHTEEFGEIKVLVTPSLANQCYLLIVTPEQVAEIVEWLP